MDYDQYHMPVMVQEVLNFLEPIKSGIILDCTLGLGGHTEAILRKIPGVQVYGLDIDEEALNLAKERLKPYEGRVKIFKDSYVNVKKISENYNRVMFSSALFDFGASLLQFTSPHRGFSFKDPGPLDMRMDNSKNFPLSQVIKKLTQREIEDILLRFGEERNTNKLAQVIYRERDSLNTTEDLRKLIEENVKSKNFKIHPATRVFQAFRIYINNELDNIFQALNIIFQVVETGGRIITISYHSLEDRIVKNLFKEKEKLAIGRVLTKKVIKPTREEVINNPRSRSAKMRVIEVI